MACGNLGEFQKWPWNGGKTWGRWQISQRMEDHSVCPRKGSELVGKELREEDLKGEFFKYVIIVSHAWFITYDTRNPVQTRTFSWDECGHLIAHCISFPLNATCVEFFNFYLDSPSTTQPMPESPVTTLEGEKPPGMVKETRILLTKGYEFWLGCYQEEARKLHKRRDSSRKTSG